LNITVGMADLRISAEPGAVLITHALGSCLGLTVYDPVTRVGGMLHAMLPDSTIDPAKATQNPAMFVDTGVPRLFRACYELGGQKTRLEVKVAGGSTIRTTRSEDYFRIGERNFVALRKLLWRNNVLLKGYDVGGTKSRTLTLDLGTGEVLVRSDGATERLDRREEAWTCH
jgi:chemotaxis protein CheD